MRVARGLIAILLSGAALLMVLRLLQPVVDVYAVRHAAPLAVVISEAAWGGTAANANAEWIELRNNTSSTIDLSGWQLFSSDGTPDIALNGVIAPGGYFLLERTADTTISDIPADQLYTGALVNTGESLTLTDALNNVIDTANGDGGAWPGGSASPGFYSMERIDPLAPDTDANWTSNDGVTRNGLDANGQPVNGTPRQPNSARSPAPPGSVLIGAVHFSAYANGDESFRLINVSTQTITLTNWVATDGEAAINLSGTLAPDQAIWLAKNAVTFTQQFGFKPDYEYDGDSDPAVPNLTGGVPLLSDDDELVIREGGNGWQDAVVWGGGSITSTGWPMGWSGLNVLRYSGSGIGVTGQLIYRKLDEATGRIISDTDTALDWANDRTDPIAGRKAMYPGWALAQFWQTAKVTATATLTVAIAPDNAFRVISDLLGTAQHSIVMEMHTFDNLALAEVLTRTLARGVSVTILLEGGPVGGLDNQEKWVCQQLEAAGGQCWFMINNSSAQIFDRYDYLHAKLIIVDDQIVAIGSENLSPRSLTYDNFADGTRGHRGVYLITDAGGVVSRALEIWRADFDPAHYRDLFRWSESDLTYGKPSIGFVPNYTVEVAGYFIRYPTPLSVTAPLTFELLTAPESALRAGDSLLGLINQSGAGDTIDVEQLSEPPFWGSSTSNPIDDPNVRLEALIAAAGRGAQVQLLLDRYFDDSASLTSNTATISYLQALRAASPTLMSNLQVRLGDPALFGLHNKLFLFNVGGRKIVHAGSLNGTETSSKVNREVALHVQSAAAYDYLHTMFEYDWAFQPRVRFPLIARNFVAPPNYLLISKVFYLGSTSTFTGSEWVQVYNPTPITVTLTGYKLGDQAAPGATGFTVDGMWQFPAGSVIGPGQRLNVAITGRGFFDKYGFPPAFAFFTSDVPVPLMSPYLQYTPNISFALANTGDEVLLLGPIDQLIDGVAWGTNSLPDNESCAAIDPSLYPQNPSIKREPLWQDTNRCPIDFVIDPLAQP